MKFRLVLTFTEINLTSQKYYERHSMAEGALNKTRENQLRTTKLKTIRAKKVNTQNSNSRYKKFWADFAFIGGFLRSRWTRVISHSHNYRHPLLHLTRFFQHHPSLWWGQRAAT